MLPHNTATAAKTESSVDLCPLNPGAEGLLARSLIRLMLPDFQEIQAWKCKFRGKIVKEHLKGLDLFDVFLFAKKQ